MRLMIQIKSFIKIRLAVIILYFKKFKPEDSIIIFSEARGGSTWLMEMLSKIPNVAINWEPLQVEKGVVPKNLKWGWQPSIPKHSNNKVYYHLIKKILEFKVFTKWTMKYFFQLSPLDMLKTKYLLTKFVRANLILGYIVNNFKLKNKPILLIRHPVDVCISKIKAFKDGDNENVSVNGVPDVINNERFVEHNEYILGLKTKLEIKVALWCLNNCLLLEDEKTLKKVTIVYYSDLVLNPKEEITKILNSLQCVSENDIQTIVEATNFRKPSQTDFKKDLEPNPEKQLYKNFEKLSDFEKDSIQKVFDYFNFNLFDAYQPFPSKVKHH